MKLVFTNGCFDLLHYGHVKFLEEAKKLGDVLVVGINSDTSVRRLKGKGRSIVKAKDRAKILMGLRCVDAVVIFVEDTPLELIKELKPDVLVKGGDWKKKDVVGKEYVKEVVIIPYLKGYSTTNLIKRIMKGGELWK